MWNSAVSCAFAIGEFRDMKVQPSLERALRHREILRASRRHSHI